MEVPLVSAYERDERGADDGHNQSRCARLNSMFRPFFRAARDQLRENWTKGLLVLATIITSTYTAYTINNLQMQTELLNMRLETSQLRLEAARMMFGFRFVVSRPLQKRANKYPN